MIQLPVLLFAVFLYDEKPAAAAGIFFEILLAEACRPQIDDPQSLIPDQRYLQGEIAAFTGKSRLDCQVVELESHVIEETVSLLSGNGQRVLACVDLSDGKGLPGIPASS